MAIHIRDTSCYKKKSDPCWDDSKRLKYLICMIDRCKRPGVSPPESLSVILPPRIEEFPCEPPPRRPPCVPPRCCPITRGPCCLRPLPPPIPATLLHFPDPCSHPLLPCDFNE